MHMRMTNYALDNFVAPHLSDLTVNSAREISIYNGQVDFWLSNFILNSMLEIKVEEQLRKYIFNFLRRVASAFHEYENGRNMLNEFLAGSREAISKYLAAVLHFEIALAHTYQAYMLGKNMAGEEKLFDKKDNTPLQRLNSIYNKTKHIDDLISKGQLPENWTIPIWLTNEGLECTEARLSFEEFADMLIELSNIAEKLSKLQLIEK